MSKTTIIYSALIAITLFSCNSKKKHTENEKIKIVTTTSMLHDVVKNITKEHAKVESLMGSGVDPHLYKAAHNDLEKLSNADIIIFNGLHLEGKMVDILKKLSRTKVVINASTPLPDSILRFPDSPETPDPHIWFSIPIWSKSIKYISNSIIKVIPNKNSELTENTTEYLKKLIALDSITRKQINSIPSKQKLLITAHDAFGYFGDEYKIEVMGLQGLSTVSQAGLKDIEHLVDVIIERRIKAIFVESSISKKQLEVVIESCNEQGHKLKIGGVLFSDAMGAPNTPEGTYIGMVKHNVNTIAQALK